MPVINVLYQFLITEMFVLILERSDILPEMKAFHINNKRTPSLIKLVNNLNDRLTLSENFKMLAV